jgi:hypothetical protein
MLDPGDCNVHELQVNLNFLQHIPLHFRSTDKQTVHKFTEHPSSYVSSVVHES